MICIDTNILIYAHRRGAVEHEASRAAIERAAEHPRGWGISWPSLGEFWAQVTHPRYPGKPSSPALASGFIRHLVDDARARVFMPPPALPTHLLEVATRFKVVGPRIFDVQIALIAKAGGARRLWTHDAGFTKIPGLIVEDPLV